MRSRHQPVSFNYFTSYMNRPLGQVFHSFNECKFFHTNGAITYVYDFIKINVKMYTFYLFSLIMNVIPSRFISPDKPTIYVTLKIQSIKFLQQKAKAHVYNPIKYRHLITNPTFSTLNGCGSEQRVKQFCTSFAKVRCIACRSNDVLKHFGECVDSAKRQALKQFEADLTVIELGGFNNYIFLQKPLGPHFWFQDKTSSPEGNQKVSIAFTLLFV